MIFELALSFTILFNGSNNEHLIVMKEGKKVFATVIERGLKFVTIRRRGMTITLLADDIKSIRRIKEKKIPTSNKKPKAITFKKNVDISKKLGQEEIDKARQEKAKALIARTIKERLDNLDPIWEQIKHDPLNQLKIIMPKPSKEEAQVVIDLFTHYLKKNELNNAWIWFLRGGRKRHS